MSNSNYWHDEAIRLAEDKARLLAALKLVNGLLEKVCNEKNLWLVESVAAVIEDYTPKS